MWLQLRSRAERGPTARRGSRLSPGAARSALVLLAVLACLLHRGTARAQSPSSTDPGGHPRAELHLGSPEERTAKATSVVEHAVDVTASMDVAGYLDSDNVYVLTPSIAGGLTNAVAGWSVNGRYLVDVVSAASADVVSTASPPFVEVRHAGTLDAAFKPHTFGVAANTALSFEPDYTSVMGGATVTQDLFEKNLTLLLGYSHLHDIAGRSGTPFSVFARVLDRDAIKGGMTLVVDRATVLSVVADVMIEYGDPSKPYRYVPLFAPGVVVPRGASVADVTRLRLSERALEQLPDTRDRYAVSMRWAHRFHTSTLRLDQRAYVDTWGLKATTTDARWLFDLTRRLELGPHLRFYGQTPVNFWQRAYVMRPGFDYPALRTGNRELGPLLNFTGGASFRTGLGRSDDPHAWMLGVDFNLTSTQYLDDIYLTQRLSMVGSISLEAAL